MALIEWPQAGKKRVRVTMPPGLAWTMGLGDALDDAIGRSADLIDLYARLFLATDPFDLEVVVLDGGGETITIGLRPVTFPGRGRAMIGAD